MPFAVTRSAWPELLSLPVAEKILRPAVVYGYFPCFADGDDLVILDDDRRRERLRFKFPRQRAGESLCLSDYFANSDRGRIDVVALMAVTAIMALKGIAVL